MLTLQHRSGNDGRRSPIDKNEMPHLPREVFMRAGPGAGHWCRREHPYSLRCMARPPCTATDASETVRLTKQLACGPSA